MTVDYKPVANDPAANVESQAQYLTDLGTGGSLEHGYKQGIALSVQVNKTLRQSSMMAAALANFISTTLGQDVLDDGDLTNLIAILTEAITQTSGSGGGRLSYTSPTQMSFAPRGGGWIKINGVFYPVPSAGLAIANTGVEVGGVGGSNLAASSCYDLYLRVVGGVLTPSFWLDGGGGTHMTDTTAGNVGVEVRSNTGSPDSARTLVGKIGTNSSGQFVSGLALNWHDRHEVSAMSGTINVTFASVPLVEVTTSGTRLSVLTWADESLSLQAAGFCSNDTVNLGYSAQLGIDGSVVGALSSGLNPTVNGAAPVSCIYDGAIAEGRHSINLFAAGPNGGSVTTHVMFSASTRG